MGITTLKRMFSFVVFCLLQVMILNHIHLFGFITPLFYVYFLLSFEYNYPRWGILLWAFVMGVILDTFTNTPGVAAASMTFVAFIQPYFLELFVGSDASDDTSASVHSLGAMRYTYYAAVLVLIYHLLFFSLEMFSFFNVIYWLKCVFGSSALTLVLILFAENIRRGK